MIRRATLIDVPGMVELAERMHQESRFADLRFVPEKMRDVLGALIDAPTGLALVAVREGRIIGAFLAVIEEHLFSDALFAFDIATFILPGYRGGYTGPALIRAYVKWAQSKGVAKIQGGVASGINHDVAIPIFRRLGFEPVGLNMEHKGNT